MFFFLSECLQRPYPTTSRTSPPSSHYITSSFFSYLGSCWSDWVQFSSFSCFESIHQIVWKPRRPLFSGSFICHFQHKLTYMLVHLCPLGGSIVPSFPGSINNSPETEEMKPWKGADCEKILNPQTIMLTQVSLNSNFTWFEQRFGQFIVISTVCIL